MANFSVASTPRQFYRTSNEWKDGETPFMRWLAWRDAAENVAESLSRDTRVLVSGAGWCSPQWLRRDGPFGGGRSMFGGVATVCSRTSQVHPFVLAAARAEPGCRVTDR